MDLPEDHDEALMVWYGTVQAEITRQLKEKGEPVPDLNEVSQSAPIGAVDFLFPNYFLLPFFTSFSSYRIRPLGPETCFFELWSLTLFPPGEEPDPVMEPTVIPYDSPEFPPIPRQDYSNIPLQQIGLHAKGFEFMRLSKDVEGLVSNFHRVVDGYIAGRSGGEAGRRDAAAGGQLRRGRLRIWGFRGRGRGMSGNVAICD